MIGNSSSEDYSANREHVTISTVTSIWVPGEYCLISFPSFLLLGIHRNHLEMKDQTSHVSCHIVPCSSEWLGAEFGISSGACS